MSSYSEVFVEIVEQPDEDEESQRSTVFKFTNGDWINLLDLFISKSFDGDPIKGEDAELLLWWCGRFKFRNGLIELVWNGFLNKRLLLLEDSDDEDDEVEDDGEVAACNMLPFWFWLNDRDNCCCKLLFEPIFDASSFESFEKLLFSCCCCCCLLYNIIKSYVKAKRFLYLFFFHS